MRAYKDSVIVAFRDSVAAVAPRDAVDSGACSTMTCGPTWAVGADFVGIPGASGSLAAEKRPQVAGVSPAESPAQSGVAARIDVDTRFITSPSALKLAVMVLGVACVLASIVALALLDRGSGRRIPPDLRRYRRAPPSTWFADTGVVGALLGGTWSGRSRRTMDTT